jgi:3-methyladenine DNA glycosylase AlkD
MVSNISLELDRAQSLLRQEENPAKAVNFRKFFKNCKEDAFLGVSAPIIRKIAKDFYHLPLPDVLELMKSNVHDERALANAILCLKFRKADQREKTKIFKFYIKNRKHIRDWDGVDDSAPYIVGAYLLDRDKKLLYQLALSKRIWCRRIAIVSTWWFIRQNKIHDTLKIAEMLLQDEEDLIHKAVGWMLREVGKRKLSALKRFLKKYRKTMPRTMLRYAIEKFPLDDRKKYLSRK